MTMTMDYYNIVFYAFAALTLASAAVVVFSRNVVYSAFSLLFTFFGVAGIYVLLQADFVAVAQILIYVGGILVLLIFGVMLTNRVVSVDIKTGTLQTLPASLLVAMLAGTLTGIFYITDWTVMLDRPSLDTTTSTLGHKFLTSHVLPFEVASVVLVVALVGAAMLARKAPTGTSVQQRTRSGKDTV